MHVSNVNQILSVLACDANCCFPFLYQFENLLLGRAREYGRPLRESLDELIEKLFCCNLQVEWVAAILDEVIQKLHVPKQRKQV